MGTVRITDGAALDRELSGLAAAIRQKSGKPAQLTFPGGSFQRAVEQLPRPKPEQAKQISVYSNGRTVVEPDGGMALSRVTVDTDVVDTRFEDSVSGDLEGAVTVYSMLIRPAAFGSAYLAEVHLPNAMELDGYAFWPADSLTLVDAPMVSKIYENTFYGAAALETLDLPKLRTIRGRAFDGCTALKTLILRNTVRCALSVADAFSQTALTGIYVPRSLVGTYQKSTNWVTYADKIFAIEDHPEIGGTV